MNNWYKKDIFRNLVDMHIPNGDGYLEKFDPSAYADNIARSEASVAYIYGSNCLGLCFFPTNIGLRHKAAERDIFGATVKECRARGLDVVGYLNSWGSFVCDVHPEWAVRYADGTQKRDYERFGNPCINNPEYAKYFTSLVHEFVSMYELDGLWIDMVGIWSPVCYCDACKKKYFEEYKKELPAENTTDADYKSFKARSIAAYAHAIREAAHSVNNELTISIQAAGGVKYPLYIGANSLEYFTASDYLAGDFYTDRAGTNTISRMLYKLTEKLPFEFMTSRCANLESHTSEKHMGELLSQAYASFMYKGAFLFIDAIDPDGEMNSAFYEKISTVNRGLSRYIPYVDYEEKPIREIAVYYNFDGFADENGRIPTLSRSDAYGMLERLKRIGVALVSAGFDYDVISPKNISELSSYKVLVVSSLAGMSETETEAIRQFVRGGGNLYISGDASLRDNRCEILDGFLLSDVMGVDYAGRFDISPCYVAPVTECKSIFGEHTRKYPHMLKDALVKVNPHPETTVLATVTLPVSDTRDKDTFSSAISNPPIKETSFPAICENTYGDGKVIYSAGLLEDSNMHDNAELFTALIKRLLGDARVTLTAPTCVDYTVYKSDTALKINLLNNQTIYPPIPITEINVDVRLDGRKIKNVIDVSGGHLEWSVENGTLCVKTDLEVFKLVVAEFE